MYKKYLLLGGAMGILMLLTAVIVLVTPLRFFPLLVPTIDDVDPEVFFAEYSKNPDDYVFIDVRSQDAYDRIHAQGAELMPLHTLYDEWRDLPRNGDKTVVLICSGGRASGVGYHYLEHHGFYNIKRIAGGIESWHLAGLPVVTNDGL